ncbi:hypothetical protein FKM82_024084 [Ascaphus truei]
MLFTDFMFPHDVPTEQQQDLVTLFYRQDVVGYSLEVRVMACHIWCGNLVPVCGHVVALDECGESYLHSVIHRTYDVTACSSPC